MKILYNFIKLILILTLTSCSNDKSFHCSRKNIETQMIEAFEEGYEELEN